MLEINLKTIRVKFLNNIQRKVDPKKGKNFFLGSEDYIRY